MPQRPRHDDWTALVRHDSTDVRVQINDRRQNNNSFVQGDLPSQLSALSLAGQAQPGPVFVNNISGGHSDNENARAVNIYQQAIIQSPSAGEAEKNTTITRLEREVQQANTWCSDWETHCIKLEAEHNETLNDRIEQWKKYSGGLNDQIELWKKYSEGLNAKITL
jgi:hypothetical protein